jgi:hypothetical protein
VTADDVLGFADIPPPRVRLYPLETHIAEKLHAYTIPRDRPNSRVKDLPDLALLATVREISMATLRAALVQTFSFRATHQVPTALPAPPPEWREPYDRMALSDDLPWKTLAVVVAAARAFVDPVLADVPSMRWNPIEWRWL